MRLYNYDSDGSGELLLYTDASINFEANGSYELTFTVPARYRSLINHSSVIYEAGQYFTPYGISVKDGRLGEATYKCRTLYHMSLVGNTLTADDCNFEDAPLPDVIAALFAGTPFSASDILIDDYPLVTLDARGKNTLAALAEIQKKYGGFDMFLDGANVVFGAAPSAPSRELVKGRDYAVINCESDITGIVTHIMYQYKAEKDMLGNAAPMYEQAGPAANYLPFRREIYVELPDDSPETKAALIDNILAIKAMPSATYEIDLTPALHGAINLYDKVTIYYEPLGIDITLPVAAVSRKLVSGTSDRVTLGAIPKDITDYIGGGGDGDGGDGDGGDGDGGDGDGCECNGGGLAGHGILLLDHFPTGPDVDPLEVDSIIMQYDPAITLTPAAIPSNILP